MANSVREFVIESLRGFYERLPLKKVAVDGSVLTPDASGIVNLNVASSEQLEDMALTTAAALNDLNARIESAESSTPWEHGEGENSAQLKGTIGAIGEGAVAHAYSDSAGSGEASGFYSHTEGEITNATGDYSHAEGTGKIQSTAAPANILSVAEDWRLSGIDPEEQNYFLDITDHSYYSNNYASIIQKRWTDAVWELYNEWHNNGEDVSLNLFSNFACDSDSFICDLFDTDNVEEYEYNDGEGGYIHGLLFYLDASIAQYTPVYNNSIIKFSASGEYSHTEGVNTIASGMGSHAEGMLTEVKSDYSHAEGYHTIAEGDNSHAEGYNTLAYGNNSHAEGEETIAIGNNSHAEGYKTNAYKGHAEGVETWCFSPYSGGGDNYSHAEGQKTQAYLANYETASDLWVNAGYKEAGSHAEGLHTISYGYGSHSSGRTSDMYGSYGGAALKGNFNGNYYYDTSVNIVPGTPIYTRRTVTVRGNNQNKLVDVYGFGILNYYSGGSRNRFYTSIQGYPGYFGDTSSGTVYALTAYSRILAAIGNYSTANGIDAKAYGSYSHAEGAQTLAVGAASHSEGHRTSAVGRYSHAEGYYDIRGGSDSGDNSIGFRFAKLANYAPTSVTSRLYVYGYDPSYRNGEHDVSKGLTIFDGSNYATILDKATYYYDGRYYPYFVLDNSIGTDYLSAYKVLVANGTAKGMGSHIEGTAFLAYGMNSHAEGDHTYAIGKTSHAEGKETFSIGEGSHAEGDSKYPFKGYKIISFTGTANSSVLRVDSDSSTYFKVGNTYRIDGDYYKVLKVIDSSVTFDHPFRQIAIHLTDYKAYAVSFYGAIGDYSHAEGRGTITYGAGSHAEGCETTADASYSHAEGYYTGTSGQYSHAEGYYTGTSGDYSHAEGEYANASGIYSHAEGSYTTAKGVCSHAEGYYADASGSHSHAEGNGKALGQYSHAEGCSATAVGVYSHAEGGYTKSRNRYSHAEGFYTDASGNSSHAEGSYTKASGNGAHAEGKGKDSSYVVFKIYMSTCTNSGTRPNPATFDLASNVKNPFKVGDQISCINKNVATVTEVTASRFKTDTSICEWFNTPRTVTFYLRNLAGYDASNNISDASGMYSHTEGILTQAFNEGEHANGLYNLSNVNVSMENDTSTSTLFTIGCGDIYETDSSHWLERKNAVEVMRNGAVYITGIGGYNGTNPGYGNSSTLQEVVNNSGGGASDFMTSITYSDLKALRDSSSLVPGMQYRITDYECTTTQPETQAASNLFDIIVTADSSTVLNENARACHHAGDTYFQNCKLEVWELKYSLDNDASTYYWADTRKGKGVVYYMKDEWNNECPYDFKNIKFKRYAVTECVKCPNLEVNDSNNTYGFYYGIKSIYGNPVINATYDDNTYGYFYTFALKDLNAGTWHDYTVAANLELHNSYSGIVSCYNNSFSSVKNLEGEKQIYALNNIVLYNVYDNLSITSTSENWNDCYSNKTGDNCFEFTCGVNCNEWTCGNGCAYWACGNNCVHWTCGEICSNWTCGDDCNYWTCGNYCYDWSCGNHCSYWSCGNDCTYWTCGNSCGYWTCGNMCWSWSCGNSSSYWTCGNHSHDWSCGESNNWWICGNGSSYWSCGNNCSQWSCGNGSSYWSCGNYVQKFTIFDSIYYLNINSSGGTSSASIRNFQVLNGTKGTNTSNRLAINFEANKDYTQIAGLNSSGVLKIWTPADFID